jgi:WD40 repeat protein
VTCVAVSKGPKSRILSASEDQTVRIWAPIVGDESRWQELGRLEHHAVVRSLACTTADAPRNLLLTGTATGRARLFDLDKLDGPEITLEKKHSGAINAVAFSWDGKLCVTGGEDHSICLYETAEGKVLGKFSSAHNSGITSLAFTKKDQVVSAGKDRQLILWNLVEGGEGGKTLAVAASTDRRSGDVAVLGVDPKGEQVLIDEGRELQIRSLQTRNIEGRLANAPGTPAFSTMALFSPNGSTILTNGNAAGRVQLWRTPSPKTRAAELRQFAWTSANVTCAAFDPAGKFVVTGTQDARVLVWTMPGEAEAKTPLRAELSYVEEFLDTSLREVAVRATFDNPEWRILPGSTATLVIPVRAGR